MAQSHGNMARCVTMARGHDSMFTLCCYGPIPWQHGLMCHHGPGPCQHAGCVDAAAFHVSTLDVSAETPPLRIRKTMSL